MTLFNTSIISPTVTPGTLKRIKRIHIGAIVHYLRTVINLPQTEYVIVDVPTRRESLLSTLSSVLLVLAAFWLVMAGISHRIVLAPGRLYLMLDGLVIVGLVALVSVLMSNRTVLCG